MSATPYVPPTGLSITVILKPGYVAPGGLNVNAVLIQPGSTPVSSGAYAAVVLSYRATARRSARPLDSPWKPTAQRARQAAIAWRKAVIACITAEYSWNKTRAADLTSDVVWQFGGMLPSNFASPWSTIVATDRRGSLNWRPVAARWQVDVSVPWVVVYPRQALQAVLWRRASLPSLIYQAPPTSAYVPPAGTTVTVILAPGYVPPPQDAIDVVMSGFSQQPPVVVQRADPTRWVIRWGLVATADNRYVIRWGPGPQPHRPDPPPIDNPWTGSPNEPPPIPIARRVYIVMNDVQVVRLPERTPIAVLSVDLNASVDSWAWTVRMELADPSQLALLKPDGNGPKLVEITMNSYVWTAIIEGRERNRVFADAAVTVTGRSQTALLSGDYTAARSKSFEAAYSAQQLANLEISERALPFTVDWRGLDWVVPGGVWYYQDLAPIDVIAQIAAARGAVLQSAPGDASLIVQSRYPVSPWSWGVGNADVALPIDWVTSINAQQQSKPMYDAVIIAGQAQGVLAKVTRAASAGATFAPQVVDQLMVTPDVATERGRNILSDRGVQEQVDMDIPLFAPGTVTAGMSGLYQPLLLVDVQDPSDPWQGQTVGVSISARRGGPDNKALEIWQRVSLERHLSDAH